ncbi:MAG: molybdate ABC transporter substrate-binding protein, partial [Syntrophaceae bacterium]|nr:molybdate ABC transporter substrate-binding protein [Syntrophaceae bacterium]
MKRFILVIVMVVTLSSSALAGEITFGAGVGLKDVLNELAASFVKINPSAKITRNFAASGVLAKQLDSGAQTDIVFVANVKWMDYMKEKKHVDAGTVRLFAYNTLVFVGKGKPGISRIEELTKLEKIAIGSPKSVPAGEYAMQALKNAGIDKQLEKKLVMARDVRECLMYAERGEVNGAFVYGTDALLSKTVDIWFVVPQKLYSRVVYMSALTVSGVKNQDAVKFFTFLRSAEARAILLKYGFEV